MTNKVGYLLLLRVSSSQNARTERKLNESRLLVLGFLQLMLPLLITILIWGQIGLGIYYSPLVEIYFHSSVILF